MQGVPAELRLDDTRLFAIAAVIGDELAQEAGSGFPTLQRVPSTGAIKLLDHFDTLASGEIEALLKAQARIGALYFFPAPLMAHAHHELRTSDPALLLLAQALQAPGFSYGLRYLDLRMHRASINDAQSRAELAKTRATLGFEPRDDLPERLVGATPIQDIRTTRAPELRKLLNEALKKGSGLEAIKRPGGELTYEGVIEGAPMRISIIFSNLYAQLTYAVSWSGPQRGLLAQRLAWEMLFGAGGGWDYLTADNAARSINLLDELARRLARLFLRIQALPEFAAGAA